jgi:hypothetical protein
MPAPPPTMKRNSGAHQPWRFSSSPPKMAIAASAATS